MDQPQQSTRAEQPPTADPCGKCTTRPVAAAGDPNIRGYFCDPCIDRCHDDTMLGHLCVIDTWFDKELAGEPEPYDIRDDPAADTNGDHDR